MCFVTFKDTSCMIFLARNISYSARWARTLPAYQTRRIDVPFVGAGALLQFTYTFPVFLALGFRAQRDSALPEEVYDPLHRRVERVDHGLKRWVRGLKKELWWNIFDGVIYVGSLVTCVLGLYAGFKTLVEGYIDSPSLVGWQCSSPTG